MNDIDGAILVGGRSSRMGRDKATLLLAGKTMLERVGDAMAPRVERIRVFGGPSLTSPGFPVVPDLRPNLGPLSGIHTALATANAPAVVVVACDLPFVTTQLLSGLIEMLSGEIEAVVPRVAGRAVPVCAIYRTSCLPALEARLERGALAAHRFVDGLETRFVENEDLARLDPHGLGLRNINTPDELREAEAILAAARS
jgi:molybdopterin-guanine dinucleotide biosynthesis protein A